MSQLIRPRGGSVVDTPVERMMRERHINRLLDLADEHDDEASRFALEGNPRRADYLTKWGEVVRARANEVAMDPFAKAFGQ